MTEKPSPSLLELDDYCQKTSPREKNCEWPDCTKEGLHRAPRSRTDINSYRWFCREHVHGYNKNWNYFAGMTDHEVEVDRRSDTVWQRPSWPLGDRLTSPEHVHRYWRKDFSCPFSDLEHGSHNSWSESNLNEVALDNELKEALDIFGIGLPVSTKDVKTRYKALVKRHHPDAAKHDADEERVKDINHAYQAILAFLEP